MADYVAKVAMEKKDPNSGYSQGMKEYAKQFGYNIKGDISGEDLEKGPLKMIAEKYYKDQLDKQHRDLKALQTKEMSERARLAREDREERQERGIEAGLSKLDKRAFNTLTDRMQKAGGPTGTLVRNRIAATDNIFATAKFPLILLKLKLKNYQRPD